MEGRGRMKKLFRLFLTFLKIGAFTFGGGYAMIALLENEFVDKKKWIERDEFLDMVAIAESTPGPVAINSATYIGYKVAGFWGSLVSTLAVCLPSFVIIYLISLFFDQFLSLRLVVCAFRGIQVCVIYLIFSAGLKMLGVLPKSVFNGTIVAAVSLLMVMLTVCAVSLSSIVYIVSCGVLGALAQGVRRMRREAGKP